MTPRYLVLAGAVLAGCSSATPRPGTTGPVGCCCTFGDCRKDFTEAECAKEGQFQGWTFTWHPGACTANDTYPAPDRPATRQR
jgi:hypothetical protein